MTGCKDFAQICITNRTAVCVDAQAAVVFSCCKRQILQQNQQSGSETHSSGSEYMKQVRENFVMQIPQNLHRGGEVQHITYFSLQANREKGAHVWLPPGYDASKH